MTNEEVRVAAYAELGKGRLTEAEGLLRTLLEKEPKNVYALVGLGKVSRARGDGAEALARLEHAANTLPRHTWALLEHAIQLKLQGRREDAARTFETLLSVDPNYEHGLLEYARISRALGRTDQACELFRRLTQHHPKVLAGYAEHSDALSDLGRPQEAEAVLSAGIAACGPVPRLVVAKARIQKAVAGAAASLAVLEQAMLAGATEPDLILAYAQALVEAGRSDEASEHFQAIVTNAELPQQKRLHAAIAAGRAARRRGARPAALANFEAATSIDPAHTESRCELAVELREAGRSDEAAKIYEDVIAQNPNNVMALSGLAAIARRRKDTATAIAMLQRAQAANPGADWIKYEYAMVLKEERRFGEARTALSVIAPTSGQYGSAHLAISEILREQGHDAEAVAQLEAAARAAADPMVLWAELCNLASARGDHVSARRWITHMREKDPRSIPAMMAEGRMRRAQGDRAGALAMFTQVRDASPQHLQSRIEMATEHAALGDPASARACVVEVLAVDPTHTEAQLKLADLTAKAGNVPRALAILQRLRLKHPAQPWGYAAAAALLIQGGSYDEAQQLLDEAKLACPPSARLAHHAADILRQKGLLDEASASFRAGHLEYPHDLWLWVSLANACIQLGSLDELEALLESGPGDTLTKHVQTANFRAVLAEARNDLDEAVRIRKSALDLNPADTWNWYELARLQLVTFNTAGVRESLATYTKLQSVGRNQGRIANASQSLFGQIYDEFVIDRDCIAKLVDLAKQEPLASLASIANAVRDYPHATAPAIALLTALRRSGKLDVAPASADAQRRIPRVIIQYWSETDVPADIAGYMKSWGDKNPGYVVERFDDKAAAEFLLEQFGAPTAAAFAQATEPAQRADIFRLGRLLACGGYYADADDRCRDAIDTHLPAGCDLIGYHEGVGTIANNFLAVVPGHPVIAQAFEDAVAAVSRGDRDIVWLSTGPGLLTRALALWLASDDQPMDAKLASVGIVPIHQMRRVTSMFCPAAYKQSDRAWLNSAFSNKRT